MRLLNYPVDGDATQLPREKRGSVRLAAICLLIFGAGCGAQDRSSEKGIADRIAANRAFDAFCSDSNCDEFPTGFHSVKLLDRWYFIPIRDPADVQTSGEGSWDEAEIYLHPSDNKPTYYQYDEADIDGRRLIRSVSPHQRAITLGQLCCVYLASSFPEETAVEGFFGAQIRIHPNSISPRSVKLIDPGAAQKLAVEEGLNSESDRYFFEVSEDSVQRRVMRAISKQKIVLNQHLSFTCVLEDQIYCDVESERNERSEYPAFRLVNFVASECVELDCAAEFDHEALIQSVEAGALRVESLFKFFEQPQSEGG